MSKITGVQQHFSKPSTFRWPCGHFLSGYTSDMIKRHVWKQVPLDRHLQVASGLFEQLPMKIALCFIIILISAGFYITNARYFTNPPKFHYITNPLLFPSLPSVPSSIRQSCSLTFPLDLFLVLLFVNFFLHILPLSAFILLKELHVRFYFLSFKHFHLLTRQTLTLSLMRSLNVWPDLLSGCEWRRADRPDGEEHLEKNAFILHLAPLTDVTAETDVNALSLMTARIDSDSAPADFLLVSLTRWQTAHRDVFNETVALNAERWPLVWKPCRV